jgi:hypothetical protein
LARIYAFSYEGHYYDLAKPALFLVHGNGVPAETLAAAAPPASRVAVAPDTTDQFGVAATAKSFTSDMQVWSYDKGDFSIRMDVETGFFEHILLEVELSSDRLRTYSSGAQARLRGSPGGDTSD